MSPAAAPTVDAIAALDRTTWTPRRVALWVAIVAVLTLLPLVIRNGFYVTLATNVAITMTLTLSLNFVIGRIGVFSLAHCAFLGVVAYVAAILAQRHGVNGWLTLPVAIAGSCAVAAIIGTPVLKLKGNFLAVATLAFGLFAEVFARQASDITGGAYGITGIPALKILGTPLRGVYSFWLAAAVLLLVALLLENIRTSRLGRAIIAARDNEAAAAAAGIDIARTRLAGFILSAAIAAAAGWTYGHFHLTLNPYVLSLDITFLWLFIVLVGGLGSMRGVACATVLLVVGPELLGFASSATILISGALVLIVALLAPRGIGGLIDDIEAGWKGGRNA
jgi:branched-chain amino acid transport system permease protein